MSRDYDVQVIDMKTSESLGSYQRGEICVRSPIVMIGYLGDSESTAKTIDRHGWLHTGNNYAIRVKARSHCTCFMFMKQDETGQ